MMTDPHSHRHSFVLRIWKSAEPRQRSAPLWRGWVQHVATEENAYFRDMPALVRFIERWTDEMEREPRGDEEVK
ncbi:MAG TPA: hypothetical protein G4N94_12030 [Caldilineae bacterium]|nr:hypothetical protein [Caldilineae bacterium]